jgi:hypothetical protein
MEPGQPMTNARRRRSRASTLFIVTLTVAVCSLLVGVFLRSLIPKYRSAYQATSWRESLQAADAGVNHAIAELNALAASGSREGNYPWAARGWSVLDAAFSANGERLLDALLLPLLGGPNNAAVSRLSVDVYTRQPEAPYTPWYRIRSTGRANLPDGFLSGDRRDGRMRRMKLGARTGGVRTPHVNRTVEAIVKPRHRFGRAITAVRELSLGQSANWLIDSFDSSDPAHSDSGTAAGGVYPSNPADRTSSGNIASARTLPETTPYGELITGNGAHVDGQVQTSGGDDPATPARENVSGSSGMDRDRIRDDFDEDIPAAPRPSWHFSLPTPLGKTNFLPGLEKLPTRYVVNGGLGAFRVLPALPGTTGYVEILVRGNLDIGSGGGAEIVIPPNVKATIYVDGSVDFNNGKVNSGSGSSKVAGNLTVFGISESASATYTASGNAELTLGFYGPNYAVNLSGTVNTIGSLVARSFRINGGGNGGFHYDEALGKSGDITGWLVVSYFEDMRGGF